MLIKNATIINSDKKEEADILLVKGKIEKVAKKINEKADKIIEAKGKTVFPGFIDMHVHLRTPGREDEEDISSGSMAAAKGGFTKIFCMPNTNPAIDNESCAKWIAEEGRRVGKTDVYPIGAISKARAGKELTEFVALRRAGCLSLSDDGTAIKDSLLLRRALEYSKMSETLIISHCEDTSLSNKGSMREGAISSKYGISAIPDIAESTIVSRDIQLAQFLRVPIHLAHISTAKSVDIIRRAKKQGVKVTAETAPHYFILSADDVEKNAFDSNFKVNPPLGDEKDIEAIKKALKDGTIDCIATDHAPHSKAEKELPFENAPFGFIGLEFAFSLIYTHLVVKGVLSIEDISKKLSFNPAQILGLKGCGKVEEGFCADLVIVDLDKKWEVRHKEIVSKSKNTPFLGAKLNGVVETTIYNGKIVYNSKNES
ncbi:MAG: dihydroorotase [Candidatus Omnitrophica bacterium]|nr:dihydroorotase [Candidatus Omnitrophota bacterium]